MNAKRTIVFAVALTMLVSALAFAPAASARVWVRGGVQVYGPPPPLRHEVLIARPGPRYVWVPGYWNWEPYRRHYVWIGGRWLLPPYPRAAWVGPRVVYRHHHRYYYRGYWRR
ncbi:MAG TPA: hypothetical protein VGH73_20875 [Thermoanaerobaculia bacterium]|jgi:hypothetical protein